MTLSSARRLDTPNPELDPAAPTEIGGSGALRASGIRFLLVGGANTALGFCTFRLALRALGDRPAASGLAQAISYAIGFCISYALNRRWTFSAAGGAHRRAFPRFVAAQLGALALSTSLIQIGVLRAGLRPTISWVLATGIVTVVNFTTQRFWVFSATSGAAASG